ncbi:hypothetical protein A3K71_06635 [archaeon RBG_16_50_20]|nr:MAG: hypothetical protein A3K71_06635 [archaeon RBG_16_50_20]
MDKKPNGAAVAAYISAMLGLLVMGTVHTMTGASASFSTWVLSIGKLWIPNAQGIGPYSGKETFLLVAWILSWAVLHMLLRKRDVKLAVPVVVFVVGMALATLFVYTPFIDFILGK